MVITADGVYSKHYYAGSQRIVSRLGDNDASIFETGCPTCKQQSTTTNFDTKKLQEAQKTDLQRYANLLKKGAIVYKDYKPISLAEQEKALATENDGKGEERPPYVYPMYFYHPDHLGTSTALTDFNGNAYQFFLNLPFGETMAQQLGSNYYNSPYKFNGKELDEETGLHYYGARYYDPRISIWQSVDPLAERGRGISPYVFCMNNPINMIDPDGRWPIPTKKFLNSPYGKLYLDLYKNNSAYKNIISKYNTKSNLFKLTLDFGDKGVPSSANALTTSTSWKTKANSDQKYAETPLTRDVISGENCYSYERTDFGKIRTIIHEALHSMIAINEVEKDESSHSHFNNYRDKMISALTEYNIDNNLGYDSTQINEFSYLGTKESKQFKEYIKGLSDKNGTTYENELNSFNERTSKMEWKLKETVPHKE